MTPLLTLVACLCAADQSHTPARPTIKTRDIVSVNQDVVAKVEDRKLADAIWAVIKEGATPDRIEKVVGREAVLNTTREFCRLRLEVLRLTRQLDRDILDLEREPLMKKLRRMKDVVLWQRPMGSLSFIGVYWDHEGKATMFNAFHEPP